MGEDKSLPFWPFLLSAICLPIVSGLWWTFAAGVLMLVSAKVRGVRWPSIPEGVCVGMLLGALTLQVFYFGFDLVWPLAPVQAAGQERLGEEHVTIYVATRDFFDYPAVLASIYDSYSQHPELPQLKLVLLDVGSIKPIKAQHHAVVERINATGDSGFPVFHAWEHIARTVTSRRMFYFDEDNLLPESFDWPRYMKGSWFFAKDGRPISDNMALSRTDFVAFVSRLRAAPHLYKALSRWGGAEDAQAVFAMNLQRAPEKLTYYKSSETWQVQEQTSDDRSWFDSTHVSNSYMLEWLRQGDPPASFCAHASGFGKYLCQPFSTFLRPFAVFAVAELLCLLADVFPPKNPLMRLVTSAQPWNVQRLLQMVFAVLMLMSSCTILVCMTYRVPGLKKLAGFDSTKEFKECVPLVEDGLPSAGSKHDISYGGI